MKCRGLAREMRTLGVNGDGREVHEKCKIRGLVDTTRGDSSLIRVYHTTRLAGRID